MITIIHAKPNTYVLELHPKKAVCSFVPDKVFGYVIGEEPPRFPVPACYSPETIFAAYHALALMKTFFEDTRVYYGAKNYPL